MYAAKKDSLQLLNSSARSSKVKSGEQDQLYEHAWRHVRKMQYDQAILLFNRLLKLNPCHLAALKNLGFCFHETGRLNLALKTYELARHLAPQNEKAMHGLANCYETMGNFEAAATLYHAILNAHPGQAEGLYNLARLGNYNPDDELISQLLARYHTSTNDAKARSLICFALGHVFEAHDLQRAFSYYEEGNRLEFARSTYNEALIFRYLDLMERSFDTPLMANAINNHTKQNPDIQPIFVLGMPRSGTSLVEQILASHPLVHGAGELGTLPNIMTQHLPALTGSLDPSTIRQLDAANLASLAAHYLNILKSHSPDKPYVVDKMPNNIFNIGVIRLLFPHAPIIHCVRDPMDTCWSLYKHRFNEGHDYSYDQESLGRYFLRYQQLMRHWHTVLPGQIYDIHYESLIAQPQPEIEGLLAQCDLPWDENCLNFHQTNRSVRTASMRQVRKPIYHSSIHSWRAVAKQLEPLRQALGYDAL